MIGGYMSFIKIRGKKFTLAEYLTEDEIAWLIKKNIIAKNKYRAVLNNSYFFS